MEDAENLNLNGRKLAIRYSNDKSHLEGGNDGKGAKGGANKFSVFVGNLSFKSNENSIRKFFSSCGKILDIRIAKNEELQKAIDDVKSKLEGYKFLKPFDIGFSSS